MSVVVVVNTASSAIETWDILARAVPVSVAGILIFFVGLAFVVLNLYTRHKGYRVIGKVIGAVIKEREKKKKRNGVEQIEKKRTILAVYEYINKDGRLVREISSDGGDYVGKLTTGQSIGLVVCTSSPHYDDVYRDSLGASVFGGILMCVGAVIIGYVFSRYGANPWLIFGDIALLCFGCVKIYIQIGRRKPDASLRPSLKQFDAEDIVPVESLSKN